MIAGLAPGNSRSPSSRVHPEEIRGYGHVKAKSVVAAKKKEGELMARWRDAAPAGGAGRLRRTAVRFTALALALSAALGASHSCAGPQRKASRSAAS